MESWRTQKHIQSTEAYVDSLVTIHYYDGPELTESSGMWYEDDGLTNEAFEKGLFKLLHMNMSQNKKKIVMKKKVIAMKKKKQNLRRVKNVCFFKPNLIKQLKQRHALNF